MRFSKPLHHLPVCLWLVLALWSATATAAWTYEERPDKMRGRVDKYAYTTAKAANLPWELTLVVSNEGGTLDIHLVAPDGQVFKCLQRCQFPMKIDDSPVSYPYFASEVPYRNAFLVTSGPSGMQDVYLEGMLGRIKRSKTVIFEVTFVLGGTAQFEFAIDGLKWQ